MRGRQVAPAPGSAPGRVRPVIMRRCVQIRADANGNGNYNNPNNDPANNPLANGVSPNYRVPYNTNVNAAPRVLAPFLTNPATQPASAITPAIEGNFKATGRTVVITGGSQGVGRAAALVFARKGYNVVVAAREPTRLQHVVEDCAAAAGRVGAAMAVPCDVTNERQVQALVNTVLAKFEGVDVVVNAAGVFARGSFMDTPAAEAKRLMDVNYLGPYMVAQAFMPVLFKGGLKARGPLAAFAPERPSLIFLTGFSGKVPTKYMSAFSASKAALETLASTLRTEVESQGVHVGVVQPGLVKSNFMERAAFYGKSGEEDRRSFRQLLRGLPISQTPAEVADAVYNCAASKSNEVSVGLPFAAAAQAYKFVGLNPSAVPFT
ncbi:hypothetical protein HYH02_012201 [Chlamydomonas schloesseri]|uniref:Uncharacterized protein n=1 Tax=Chlamydomonas schloesseri TaxID=2026947 RepID=A0A835W2D9_9CHLO|nr:hypothetical protein HYH02_012201 [Chlamydomonas schloesseri]|eukprot:KAG2434534.1 hypothetical protein HYH02_012201 [Chlamydomonas schloesseri]